MSSILGGSGVCTPMLGLASPTSVGPPAIISFGSDYAITKSSTAAKHKIFKNLQDSCYAMNKYEKKKKIER
jgi:hypothetical protein